MYGNPGDLMEIGAFAEMKTDFDIMSKVSYMESAGCRILGESGPVLGGYCRPAMMWLRWACLSETSRSTSSVR
jgi:hypothetical protein